jgi:hypothetical protein
MVVLTFYGIGFPMHICAKWMNMAHLLYSSMIILIIIIVISTLYIYNYIYNYLYIYTFDNNIQESYTCSLWRFQTIKIYYLCRPGAQALPGTKTFIDCDDLNDLTRQTTSDQKSINRSMFFFSGDFTLISMDFMILYDFTNI